MPICGLLLFLQSIKHIKSNRNKMNTFAKILMMLSVVLMLGCNDDSNEAMAQTTMSQKMYITIDGVSHAVTLVDNAATQALVTKLKDGNVTVSLNSSGGFEIWGALGFSLPTSNEQITAHPGDVILYNGSNICLFYGSNSWSYTRLGHIDELSVSELRTFLKAGESNISVTLSLEPVDSGISQVKMDARPQDDTYYNLNGQKVVNPSHGIYIKNGEKVIL